MDYQADRSRWATLCQATRSLPNYRISMAAERRRRRFQSLGQKNIRIQQDCRTEPSALGESIRSRGFPRDHWLLKRRRSFSTAIPGTAPKRHTSSAHPDAGSNSEMVNKAEGKLQNCKVEAFTPHPLALTTQRGLK